MEFASILASTCEGSEGLMTLSVPRTFPNIPVLDELTEPMDRLGISRPLDGPSLLNQMKKLPIIPLDNPEGIGDIAFGNSCSRSFSLKVLLRTRKG
jgi:hypothetical protein